MGPASYSLLKFPFTTGDIVFPATHRVSTRRARRKELQHAELWPEVNDNLEHPVLSMEHQYLSGGQELMTTLSTEYQYLDSSIVCLTSIED